LSGGTDIRATVPSAGQATVASAVEDTDEVGEADSEAVETGMHFDTDSDSLDAADAEADANAEAEAEADALFESSSRSRSRARSRSSSGEGSNSNSGALDGNNARLSFGPFQAAANVMPYNIQTDPMHHMGNPFIRGFNPAFDGWTPQTGGSEWNNPNGPYWSPFHWSAPESYWSVYPPQYASHYVDGPSSFAHHPHHGGMYSSWDEFPFRQAHGDPDPHVFGPHLDWPFGAFTADVNHLPGMGAGTNDKLPFPQFLQVATRSRTSQSALATATAAAAAMDSELAADAAAEQADDDAAQRALDDR